MIARLQVDRLRKRGVDPERVRPDSFGNSACGQGRAEKQKESK